MSTSSKPKSRPPSHQNRTAFRHNKNSKLTKKIAETAHTGGLCQRCTEKVQWRVRYRKYKPLSAPRKCNKCNLKNIKAAYRSICSACAGRGANALCQGCATPAHVNATVVGPDEQVRARNALGEIIKGMTERQRRSVIRRVERGENEHDVVLDVAADEFDSEDEEEDDDDEQGENENEHEEDSHSGAAASANIGAGASGPTAQ